uniref:DUF3149 domain-containing protein n=1 Tax=Parastrongyloides trichosuri TaxID=131310 RepID=A0A0N5A2G8_PARTI
MLKTNMFNKTTTSSPDTRVLSDLETYGPIILLGLIVLLFTIASIIGNRRMQQHSNGFEHSQFGNEKKIEDDKNKIEKVVITDGSTGESKAI